MILQVASLGSDFRKHFVLNRPEDFEQVFRLFPETREVVRFAPDLEAAARDVALYLSRHHMEAWLEQDPQSGMLVKVAAVFAVACATAFGTPPFGASPEDDFLWAIQAIESASGTNLNHQVIQHGPHRGERAIGRWGLLKSTIEEFAPARMSALRGMDRDRAASYLADHPTDELVIARALAAKLLRKSSGDYLTAAYGWLHGHNLDLMSLSKRELSSDRYVERFQAATARSPFWAHRLSKNLMIDPVEGFSERLKAWMAYRAEKNRSVTPSDKVNQRRKRDDREDGPRNRSEKVVAVLRAWAERARRKSEP